MNLYNNLIDNVRSTLSTGKRLSSGRVLPTSDKSSVIFLSDTAFELGGNNKPCISALAISEDMEFSNSVYLSGDDLDKIKGDSPFAKFVFIQLTANENEQDTFNKIKELEALRYRLSVEGFMTRASAFNLREQIRVSKKALKSGVTLGDLGATLIDEYLKFPYVKSVEIRFATSSDNFDELSLSGKKINQTTAALNHIFDNVMFDCSSCNLKEICDEVEGLKKLHLNTAKK